MMAGTWGTDVEVLHGMVLVQQSCCGITCQAWPGQGLFHWLGAVPQIMWCCQGVCGWLRHQLYPVAAADVLVFFC
jgi:hypothetical protein